MKKRTWNKIEAILCLASLHITWQFLWQHNSQHTTPQCYNQHTLWKILHTRLACQTASYHTISSTLHSAPLSNILHNAAPIYLPSTPAITLLYHSAARHTSKPLLQHSTQWPYKWYNNRMQILLLGTDIRSTSYSVTTPPAHVPMGHTAR